ncbi:choice-of-anchor V domain-containing protein [Fodinibius sediminis]|uniref:Reeler domain-containing protein n=1 Tax=Fodinibius sediminis TaxID=1214077 RepID=A0A521BJ49_9BACT|nr:choice-of-anchor V domain-containing protein [Fodinibius sediminis]SMO47164.1 Reeler domain-containing protein [Fodinibius sediminis]
MKILYLPLVTIAAGLLFSAGQSATRTASPAYPEHLTGAFTGGFGEQTCRSCHFDYELNPAGGQLSVTGIPETIDRGERIEIQLRLTRDQMGRAGFQLAARYEDGIQAGSFDISESNRIILTPSAPDSLEYVQHSSAGSKPLGDGRTSWTVNWKAPERITGNVVFNVVANAANGDQSEFGDFIYAREIRVQPQKGAR